MSTETISESDSAIGQNIGREILRQVGNMSLMSLGARQVVTYPYGYNDARGGVFFTVGNGRWICEIVLEFSDTYTVRFITKQARNVRYELGGVYCDQLAEVLLVGFDKALYNR